VIAFVCVVNLLITNKSFSVLSNSSGRNPRLWTVRGRLRRQAQEKRIWRSR